MAVMVNAHIDFGYPWWLSYGHVVVFVPALALLLLCHRTLKPGQAGTSESRPLRVGGGEYRRPSATDARPLVVAVVDRRCRGLW